MPVADGWIEAAGLKVGQSLVAIANSGFISLKKEWIRLSDDPQTDMKAILKVVTIKNRE